MNNTEHHLTANILLYKL